LKKVEEKKEDVGFTANKEELSYHKIRDLIDELELNRIIAMVHKAIGGYFGFKIIDEIKFRNYLYLLIEEILHKIDGTKKKRLGNLKIDWKNPWIVGIGTGIILIILGTIFALIFNSVPKNSTEIGFDFVSFKPHSFLCNNNYDFNITYRIAHIDGKPVGFGQPYYIFINQTKNTCLDNFTFFNNSRTKNLLCYNKFYEGNEIIGEACNPELEPLNHRTITAVSDQSQLVWNMKNSFRVNNISDCEIEEQIKICIESDGKNYCDKKISNAKLKYFCS